nr:hypothetical protein [Tanacetum cinerariifolium]
MLGCLCSGPLIVVKKKVTITANDNIVPEPDVAFKVGKCISLTEAAEEEATRQVHATHARIVTEPVPEPARRTPLEQNAAKTIKALKERVLDEENVTSKANVILGWGSKQENEEMTNAEVEESGNGDEEVTDAAKVDAGKTEKVKDDAKKAQLYPTSSSLSVSLGFGDQFLKLTFDTFLIGTIKDTSNVEINSLMDIKIQYEVPHIQSPTVLTIPVLMISEPLVLTSPTVTNDVPESDAITIVQLRVAKLEKDMSEVKKIDHSAEALATLKSQVPMVVEHYLGFKIGDDLQKTSTIDIEQEPEKSASNIPKIKKEQAKKQKMPKYIIKSTNKAALKVYDLKSALYQTINENKSFNRNHANHTLYHDLMEALIEDGNAMDKGFSGTGKKTKRRRTKESESSMKPSTTKETSKGKALSKSFKTGMSTTTQEPIEEPIGEVVMDDQETTANEDMVNVMIVLKIMWHQRPTNLLETLGSNNLLDLLLLILNGTSVKL